jgi:hypothetical protein
MDRKNEGETSMRLSYMVVSGRAHGEDGCDLL